MDGPKPCTAPTAMGAELQRRAHDNATLHAEVASLAARLAFATALINKLQDENKRLKQYIFSEIDDADESQQDLGLYKSDGTK